MGRQASSGRQVGKAFIADFSVLGASVPPILRCGRAVQWAHQAGQHRSIRGLWTSPGALGGQASLPSLPRRPPRPTSRIADLPGYRRHAEASPEVSGILNRAMTATPAAWPPRFKVPDAGPSDVRRQAPPPPRGASSRSPTSRRGRGDARHLGCPPTVPADRRTANEMPRKSGAFASSPQQELNAWIAWPPAWRRATPSW